MPDKKNKFKAAKEDTKSKADPCKDAGSSKQKCPLEDEVELVELVEVIAKAPEKTRKPKGRRQYINLDFVDDYPERGRVIYLKARVQWKKGDKSRSLSGKAVYWYSQTGKKNRTKLLDALKSGFGSANSGEKTPTTTDDKGWTSVVEFHLSQYGGDSFDVFATDDKAYKGGKKAGTYTVWRKLFFELDCMKRSNKGTFADRADTSGMKKKMEEVFLEVEQTGKDNSPAYQRILSETECEAWTKAVRDGTGSPRYYHLVLVDTIAWKPASPTVTYTFTPKTKKIELPADQNNIDPRDWFVSATYTEVSSGKAGVLPQAKFRLSEAGTYAGKDDRYEIEIDLSSVRTDPKSNFEIDLTFKNWQGLSGLQSGPATILGMRWREALFKGGNLVNSTLNTMIHEPGHAMGLASVTFPDGTNCTTTYYLNGHHCNNLSNGCVMWETNSISTTLCPNCSDAIRGRNLSSLPVHGDHPF